MNATYSQTLKSKFHYASWFETGWKLVADRFEAGRRPASNLSATSFQPASVMEFGFYSQITFSLSLWIWQLGKWMASTVKQRNVNSQLTR